MEEGGVQREGAMGRRADEHRDGETFPASAPGPNTRGRKVRARPASARPSGRAPTTSTQNNGVGACRRREHWPRHLPHPRDDCSSNGDCSSRSGSAGRGNSDGHDGYRDRWLHPASSGKRARMPAAATAMVDVRTRKGGREKWWSRYCAVGMGGMDVVARRALGVRTAAAAVAAGEAEGNKPPVSTEKAFIAGGARGAGRPYMSRADRAAEESNEVAQLRGQVDFWRAEAGAARQEAAETCKRLETQEQHIAGVLQKTAEVLPGYCYGMDFGGGSGPNPLVGEPRLSVLEHRRELEKVLVVRRLKGQVSRLSERLATAEEELLRVKRSCQFTALTEMLSTGEEYVKEVERLRAMLNKHREHTDMLSSGNGYVRPHVVAIPSAAPNLPANSKPPNAGETASNIDVASALESADHPEHPLSSDGGRSGSSSPLAGSKPPRQSHPQHSRGGQSDQQLLCYPTSQQQRRSHRRGCSPPRDCILSKDAQRALDREPSTRHGREADGVEVQQGTTSPGSKHTHPSYQQRSLAAAHSVARHRGSGTHRDNAAPDGRRRQRGRRGDGVVRSRARAGLLGVPAPVGSHGYISIDAPMRGGAATARGGSGAIGGPRDDGDGGGVDRGGTVAKGGRVPMTSEMEMDVMKGLVLAQHQRIERQRGRMQELERDLRDYRRATVGGGEWPQASPSFSTSLRPASPSSRGGLTPSRSAPAGLHNAAEERIPVPAPTITVARTHGLRNTSGGSRAPTAAQRRAEAARLLEETAWLKLKEASRVSGWKEGGGDAQTDVSLVMNRPRSAAATAAAAVGSVLTQVWCGRDIGGGVEGKPRPKSASSRFATSPGRRRARRARGAAAKRGGGADAKGEEGACLLPEGWAEAVDKDTGHVYYYSEKRSMWVKPTLPASPRTPETAEGSATANNDEEATGVAASFVVAATELACSRLASSTNKEVDEKDDNEGGEERYDAEGGGGREQGEIGTHETVQTPPDVTGGIINEGVRGSTSSKGIRRENDREKSRGGERDIQHQEPLETVGTDDCLGRAEAGSGEYQRLGNVRSGPRVGTGLALEEPSEHEGLCVGDNTTALEKLERSKREPSDRRVHIEHSSHPVGAVGGGSRTSVGGGDTSTQPRLGSLTRNGPCLPHTNTALSSTSIRTNDRSCLHPDNKSVHGLAHTVAAHAIGTAISQPPYFKPHNTNHSTGGLNERAERSAGSARGPHKERSPGCGHHGEEDDDNERDDIVDLSVDSDYAPPLSPESAALPGPLAVAPAPSSAIVHADAALKEREGGDAGHESATFPDAGEHPLSLEETENAMAALIATLRREPTTLSFGETPPSPAVAPLDGGPSNRGGRVPVGRSSSSFPLTPQTSDADGVPLSLRLHTTKRLQPRENPTEVSYLIPTPPLPDDHHHDLVHRQFEGTEGGGVQRHTESIEGGSALDEETRLHLPKTGNAADGEGVRYGGGVLWKGVDTEVSRGFGGGNPGGGESGEGGESGAATGVYEDDFDDD